MHILIVYQWVNNIFLWAKYMTQTVFNIYYGLNIILKRKIDQTDFLVHIYLVTYETFRKKQMMENSLTNWQYLTHLTKIVSFI